MHNTRKITPDLTWLGASDLRLSLFENVYPLPHGISYNSYLLKDEQTALLDTVDASVAAQFMENLQHELGSRRLDYLIVNHMEPDHCSQLSLIKQIYPEAKIVCNAAIKKMIEQFFALQIPEQEYILVKDGDILKIGHHELRFIFAPMVHWPEVMMTYDAADKILFSADAFGTFGALSGNIFADEVDFARDYLDEARRYYTNIVGKYGAQVKNVLQKASALEIARICPLHGFIWRNNLDYILAKYQKWAAYEPEDKAVVIACGSIYGNTYNAATLLATKLAEKGIKNIKLYDVSKTHQSYILSEFFRASIIVLAAATYNGGIFVNMENLLHDVTAHNLQNRKFALIENGTWAPLAAKLMKSEIEKLKNCLILEPTLSIKSSLSTTQYAEVENLAETINGELQ